jgi:hypothetical protein
MNVAAGAMPPGHAPQDSRRRAHHWIGLGVLSADMALYRRHLHSEPPGR